MGCRLLHLAALLLLLASGCADERPELGGGGGGPGGGGGGGGSADANVALDATDAANTPAVRGRLCNAPDLRTPAACPARNLANIQVVHEETGSAVLTDADGQFEFPSTERIVTLVAGQTEPTLHSTMVRFDVGDDGAASNLLVPIILAEDWTTLLSTLGLLEGIGDAAIVIKFLNGDLPAEGVTAVNDAFALTRYDNGDPLEWRTTGGTGAQGTALLVLIPTTADPDLEVTMNAGGDDMLLSIPVRPDTTTFLTVDLAR